MRNKRGGKVEGEEERRGGGGEGNRRRWGRAERSLASYQVFPLCFQDEHELPL